MFSDLLHIMHGHELLHPHRSSDFLKFYEAVCCVVEQMPVLVSKDYLFTTVDVLSSCCIRLNDVRKRMALLVETQQLLVDFPLCGSWGKVVVSLHLPSVCGTNHRFSILEALWQRR